MPQPILSQALLSLYRHGSAADFATNVVDCLRRVFPGSAISIDEVFYQSGEVCHRADVNYINDPKIWEAWRLYSHQHPGVRYVADGGTEPIVRLLQMLSVRQLKSLDLYHEIYKKTNVLDQLAMVIPQENSGYGIALSYPGEYTAHQQDLLAFLYPHIVQARHNALTRETAALSGSQNGTDYLEIPLQLNGWTREWPAEAQRVFAYFFGPSHHFPYRPPAEVIDWIKERRRLFKENSILWRRLGPLVIHRGHAFLSMNLSASRDKFEDILSLTYRLESPHGRKNLLTVREKQIASWIARGKSNGEIGQILGIRTLTVKKHLEHIFQKLGIENRVTLAILFNATPP